MNPATKLVIPAAAKRRAGTQKRPCDDWIPEFARVTGWRVPYLFNLHMDPMELFDPHSPEWGYMARKLFAAKLWTLIPAQGLIAAHIKSLQEWPPRQRAQSLSLQKAMEAAMQSLERAPSGMQ